MASRHKRPPKAVSPDRQQGFWQTTAMFMVTRGGSDERQGAPTKWRLEPNQTYAHFNDCDEKEVAHIKCGFENFHNYGMQMTDRNVYLMMGGYSSNLRKGAPTKCRLLPNWTVCNNYDDETESDIYAKMVFYDDNRHLRWDRELL
jgi:hypothetical protein